MNNYNNMNDQIIKTLSCGIILVNKKSEILLIHATSQWHWDIPKGTKLPGETEIQTAIRELKEETGIILTPEALEDISYHEYNSHKDLWLFIGKMPDINMDSLICSSKYMLHGQLIPEADKFGMFHHSLVSEYCCRSLVRAFEKNIAYEIEKFHRKNFL